MLETRERRNDILKSLKSSIQPIKGSEIAKKYNVSRQVIVQDIAILRAKGEKIIATPQGYMNGERSGYCLTKKIVSKHYGYEAIREELNIIIDNGGKLLNVIVEHPVYGEIISPLMISSRLDVKNFMIKLERFHAEPLSALTEGIHIHTIQVPDENSYNEIIKELNEKKYLIDSM